MNTSSAATPQRRCLVVVGAGRSGTSTLTRGLQALGVELGDHLKPPGHKNAKGFFEDQDILSLNYRLHDLLGLRRNGSSLRPVSEQEFQTPAVGRLADEAVATLARRFGDEPLWGFKCIGVLRLLPFWKDVLRRLELSVGYAVAIRNPLSVAGSRRRLDYYRGLQDKCDLEWLVHTVPYLGRVVAQPCTVVDYDRLMDDPRRELRRIARDQDLALTEPREQGIEQFAQEFVSPELRHNASDLEALGASGEVNPLTRETYLWLHELGRDLHRPADAETQRQWHALQRQVDAMAPALRHIDRLEDELRGRLLGLNGLWKTLVSRLRPRAGAPRTSATTP